MAGLPGRLRAHQQAINRLNVYPVPDGDTGTNMALTLDAVVAELDALDERSDMAEVCKAVAHGSLMGARGNSGVILSQLLRGMADRFGPGRGGRSGRRGRGLVEASDLAHQAVVRPVEGTILTVARAAGDGAAAAGRAGGGARRRWSRRPGRRPPTPWPGPPSCWRCWPGPGVVDAGGAGYLLLLDALLRVDGRPLPDARLTEPRVAAGRGRARPGGAMGRASPAGSSASCATRSCTSSTRPTTPSTTSRRCGPGSATRSWWSGATGCGTATSTPTTSGRRSRRPSTPAGRGDIRVTDLAEQVEEERWVREGRRR